MKRFIDRTLVEYLIVGILNFILCTGIMFLLFNLWGVSTHLAPLVNYGLGSVNWYLSCKFIVFRERQSTGQQLLRFVAEVLSCYLVSYYVIARPCAARCCDRSGCRSCLPSAARKRCGETAR